MEAYREDGFQERKAALEAVESAAKTFREYQSLNPVRRLLAGNSLYDSYFEVLTDAFEFWQTHAFHGFAVEVLRDVIDWIRRGILDGSLKATIRTMEDLKAESRRMADGAEDPDAMIRGFFGDEQKKDSLRRDVLVRIAAAATDAEAGREAIGATVRDGVQSALDRAFSAVNNRTLRDQLAGVSAANLTAHAMNAIAPHLDSAAQAMFDISADVRRSTVSVSQVLTPGGMPEVRNGIWAYLMQGRCDIPMLKPGLGEERVYWLNTVAGLALHDSAQLAGLREACARYGAGIHGLHLVMPGETDRPRDIRSEWYLLPDPHAP